ncbi:MAG: ribulose-phosphate 3-epimerase [Dehalococcoidia bacterium]
MTIRLAPSILTADFGRLADEVRAAEAGGADLLHLDVMDGRFVPNITFGPLVIRALRRVTDLPFDIHLMIMEPERHLEAFAEGAETVNVHVEVSPHLNRTLDTIRGLGCRAGVCINPATPVAAIEEAIPDLDQIMVMTINPGWGGQTMIRAQLEKVKRIRASLDGSGSQASLEIDGGVKVGNVAACVAAGADVLVCGSSVFNNAATAADNLAALRRAAGA